MADMNKKNLMVIFFLMMAFLGGFSTACDDPLLIGLYDGWSNKGFDYYRFISNFGFQVGDCVMFCYEGLLHDVRAVTQKDYDSCNGTSPIATYNNGLDCDIITFDRAGHHYFICGHPGHCEAGQKIDIFVNPGPSPIPSSNPPPPPASPLPASVPASSSTTATSSSLYLTTLSLALLLYAAIYSPSALASLL